MTKIMRAYNRMHRLHNKGIPVLPKIIYRFIRICYSAEIPPTCVLNKGVELKHGGLGVVIHDCAIVGSGTIIYQNVTIAGKTDHNHPEKRRYPIIGNNVLIGAGACIIGGVTIGDNASIGANAVVIHDVPADSVAVGVPAKIIKKREI